MMALTFHTLDVFTKRRFGGNPLAVVLGADGLETARMQAIAAEFNLSETAFVMSPERPAHTAGIRIFTPQAELPFAGHPTVGTAALLAALRHEEVGGGRDQLVTLEAPVGLLRVGVKLGGEPDEPAYAEFDGPKVPAEVAEAPPNDDIAQAVGLIPGELNFANHRPLVFDAGVPFLFVPVASREALAKARAQMTYWRGALGEIGNNGAFLYCNRPEHQDADYRVRVFAPLHGIAEDPATGSAAAAFAGVIQRFDRLPDDLHRRRLEQGYEMGRPSEIDICLEVEGGRLEGVRVGGHTVHMSTGTLHL